MRSREIFTLGETLFTTLSVNKLSSITHTFVVSLVLAILWLYGCSSPPKAQIEKTAKPLNMRQLGEPVARLKEAVKKQPRNGRLWLSLGRLYFERREFDKAVESFRKAIVLQLTSQDEKQAYDKLGWSYYKMGQYDRALTIFEKGLSLFPDWSKALLARACVLRQKGDYDKALAEFDKLLTTNPSDLLALDNRGWTYYLLKDYDKALEDFQRAEALAQDRPSLLANVINGEGWCYYIKGDFSTALEKFTRAGAVAPPQYAYGHWDAYRGAAFSNAALGNYKLAYKMIEQAESAMAYDQNHDLALLHYIAGDKETAWKYLGGQGYVGLTVQIVSINQVYLVYVAAVEANGPAQNAGIIPGDIVTQVGSMKMTDASSFGKAIRSAAPGTRLKMLVVRQGVQRPFWIKVEAPDRLMEQDPLLAPIYHSPRYKK